VADTALKFLWIQAQPLSLSPNLTAGVQSTSEATNQHLLSVGRVLDRGIDASEKCCRASRRPYCQQAAD
jgi:ferritin-like metal-binding protein YciE